MNKAAVVGASGVTGLALLRHLASQAEWDVLAVSRAPPRGAGRYRHLAVDLLDAAACGEAFAAHRDLSHVFYCAYADDTDSTRLVERNTRMFTNLLDAVCGAPELRHVHLMEGTKWYGSHLGPFKTPAREDDPRHMPPNFYYSQQDALQARQAGQPWTWSAARPHAICGFSVGSAMNLVTLIGVYAAICKALRLPLSFPGTAENYRMLYQCCDADHLARAVLWMATEPACANEAFNITNGDLFRWNNLWPQIAAEFDLPLGPQRRISLVKSMADKGPLWEQLVRTHGLQAHSYESLAAWAFGDYVFSADYDIISDMNKARRHGFRDCVDSEAMFIRLLRQFRDQKILP